MTIKRRLFISNILMIVLPIILTAAAFLAMHSVLSGVGAESSDTSLGGGNIRLHSTVIAALVVIAIVFFLSRYLTKYITRHIMGAVDTLVCGVREISDGNLAYRIQYGKGDEFDGVCEDFNEMAARLSDMVEQRQNDENNRKELIAGISHDLRTPLTSIKAYIEGLKKGVASTPEMREKYLDTIQSKADDMEYIIRQLFLFSKIDIGEFPINLKAVDVGEVLEKMVGGLADEYGGRGLSVSLEGKTRDVYALIDTVQLGNVIQNILDNSLKYGAEKNPRVEILCHGGDGRVYITIKDNGPGVPTEMLPKIFDLFFRSDVSRNAPSNGSGLGLAISSKIIGRHGGVIIAENLPGGGLCIVISLPESEAPS